MVIGMPGPPPRAWRPPSSTPGATSLTIRAAGATAVQFNWCVNKGNQGDTNAWAAYPGDAYVNIIGLDIYDHLNPSFNDQQWAENRAQVPSLDDILAKVIASNKQIALDEWGVSHRGSNGGGDNPFYIQKVWEWVNANRARLAYESYYDDMGTRSELGILLSHKFYAARRPVAESERWRSLQEPLG